MWELEQIILRKFANSCGDFSQEWKWETIQKLESLLRKIHNDSRE